MQWIYSQWTRRAIIAISIVVIVPTALIVGTYSVLTFMEWRSPSDRVSITIDDQRMVLEQSLTVVPPLDSGSPTPDASVEVGPTSVAEALDTNAVPSPSVAANGEDQLEPTATTGDVALPPEHIQIPDIGVDTSVVLSNNQRLPEIPVAGWFYRSAFPATNGNLVIIGHVDGPAAIFQDLHQLQPGAEVRVTTRNKVHTYIIEQSYAVDADAVEVLAPTDDATITLLTCYGEWNPVTENYSQRLIAKGHYANVEDRP